MRVHFFDLISIKACEDKSQIVNKSGDDIRYYFLRKSEKKKWSRSVANAERASVF